MQVSVRLEYSVDGVVDHVVDIVPDESQLSGVNEVHEEARSANTSFHYSGRHDGGALPKLREGGPHDRMLYAIQEAKKASDEYTTKLIAAAYGSSEQSMDLAQAEAEDEEEIEAAAEAKQDRKQQQGPRGLAEEKAKKPRTDMA